MSGVLLALQQSSNKGAARILYGHKSFREYLVARYWAAELRRTDKRPGYRWQSLSGGLLDVWLDESKMFLKSMLRGWERRELDVLSQHAQEVFEDDTIAPRRGQLRLVDDERVELRHGAMVVASLVAGIVTERVRLPQRGLRIRDPALFRSLQCGFISKSDARPRVWLNFGEIERLTWDSSVAGEHWFLENAEFDHVFLRVFLTESWAAGTVFSDGGLDACRFVDCDFSGAQFKNIEVHNVRLESSDLVGVVFSGCDFNGCHLDQCRIGPIAAKDSDWQTVLAAKPSVATGKVYAVDLDRCSFSPGFVAAHTFENRSMSHWVFRNCWLEGADFRGMELDGALFEHCLLEGALFDEGVTKVARFVECAGAPS